MSRTQFRFSAQPVTPTDSFSATPSESLSAPLVSTSQSPGSLATLEDCSWGQGSQSQGPQQRCLPMLHKRTSWCPPSVDVTPRRAQKGDPTGQFDSIDRASKRPREEQMELTAAFVVSPLRTEHVDAAPMAPFAELETEPGEAPLLVDDDEDAMLNGSPRKVEDEGEEKAPAAPIKREAALVTSHTSRGASSRSTREGENVFDVDADDTTSTDDDGGPATTTTHTVSPGAAVGEPSAACSPSPPVLSREQLYIMDVVVNHKRSIFLTGGAGTGKSFLLRHILDHLDKRTTFVTAPTGIAALNVGGITIHRFAGIQKGIGTRKELLHRVHQNLQAIRQWKTCRTLVIDEVSMLSARLFGHLEFIARKVRQRDEPFGGLQLILCGDFLQLPPVSNRKRRSDDFSDDDPDRQFCFLSRAWSRVNPRVFILRTVFRQRSDTVFTTVLNELRVGQLSPDSVHTLMSISHQTQVPFVAPHGPEVHVVDAQGSSVDERFEGKTVLRATNAVVSDINSRRFDALRCPVYRYAALDSGPKLDTLSGCPAEEVIELRVGARVMLLKNIDVSLGLVNGAIGVVTRFVASKELHQDAVTSAGRSNMRVISRLNDDVLFPIVMFTIRRYCASSRSAIEDRLELIVEPQNWTVESGRVLLASRWQVPLKLAWAITIHKSQGMTLSNINVDFHGMFEEGQAYVALSRCTSLDGLTIENFELRRVRTNLTALAFYEDIEDKITQAGGDDAYMYAITSHTLENPWGCTQDTDYDDDDDEDDSEGEDDEEASQPSRQRRQRASRNRRTAAAGDADDDFRRPTRSSASMDGLATMISSLKSRIEDLVRHVPSAVADRAESSNVALSLPGPHAAFDQRARRVVLCDGLIEDATGEVPVTTQRCISELQLPFHAVCNCFLVIDTSSWIALQHRECPTGSEVISDFLQSVCNRNFVCCPQMVLGEVDDLTKNLNKETAAAARRARVVIDNLTKSDSIRLQRSGEYLEAPDVFAVGGEGPDCVKQDNSIVCYGAYLRNHYHRPVVICTEDVILSLRSRACGLSATCVFGGAA